MYTYDEALIKSLEYFGGDELAANVFLTKYALRDTDGVLLEATPDHMHRRLAKEFARIEKKKFKKPYTEDFIYKLFKDYSPIIPQGSPMYGIGNKFRNVSLSNCFVVESPYDSYGGIFVTDQQIAQISKRRGGVGSDISALRPDGQAVNNSAITTSGAVSFMHRFSYTGNEVGQKGRRGAQMLSIDVHHPDILAFATVKNDGESVTGANISVRLSDEFMEAVINDTDYEQRWQSLDGTKIISKMESARKVWNTIIHSAWFRAEPGLLFWDRIISESPADCYAKFGFRTISTNPCGEVPLSAYDSCRLLVINLMACVLDAFTGKAEFDFTKLYDLAYIAQRLMDDLVDLEIEAINGILDKIKGDPEPDHIKYTELELWHRVLVAAEEGRRTGTGITALGDVIAALGLKYGANKSIEVTEEIYKTIKLGAYRSSVDMAKELGPFTHYNAELEKDCPYIQRIKQEDPKLYADMVKYGRRNIACLTSAPTGSTSTQASITNEETKALLFGTTGGIEPCYGMSFTRRKRINPGDEGAEVSFVDEQGEGWMEFEVNHPGVQLWIEKNPDKDIELCPYYGACAEDIDWIRRVKLQAAAQKHVDHAISSTINLPKDVEESMVAKIYETAWKAGCKGMTVYRDGCRDNIITKDKKQTIFPEERPRELPCDVHHITVKGTQYFILVGLNEGRPYEVFAGLNGFLPKKIKTGTIIRKRKDFYKAVFDDADEELSPITASTTEMEECLTRLTSGLLRVGADMHFVVKQLEKVGERQTDMHSFARSVSRALKKYIPDGTKEGSVCPECGADSLVRQEGCVVCQSCGHSKCV